MNIQTIESQVWWIASVDEIRPRNGLPSPSVWMEALQKKFRFAQLPTELPKPGQGFDFKVGHAEINVETISVPLLSIYNDGASVGVQSNTRNAEIVLQEALAVFFSLGVREPTTPPMHYYVSTIVADFTTSLDGLFAPRLLKDISAAMSLQGEAHCLAVHFNFDPSKIPGRIAHLNPTSFRIERRVGVPYEQNRYFSGANTTTEKHIELLEQIEKAA